MFGCGVGKDLQYYLTDCFLVYFTSRGYMTMNEMRRWSWMLTMY